MRSTKSEYEIRYIQMDVYPYRRERERVPDNKPRSRASHTRAYQINVLLDCEPYALIRLCLKARYKYIYITNHQLHTKQINLWCVIDEDVIMQSLSLCQYMTRDADWSVTTNHDYLSKLKGSCQYPKSKAVLPDMPRPYL